jgi:ABC-2 type transport system ATP-binding protein
MPAIEIRDLKKSYGDVQAVRGIDLNIEEGEVFGLLGPNGAGKTTTVEILEGYRKRDSGTVSVLGTDPQIAGRKWRSRVGIVFQECGFPLYSTVFELVDLYGSYYPTPLPTLEVIKIVGLEEKTDERIKRLSGGQKRRLDLALALVGNPDLIFLDEPTTGFDPSARRTAWEAIRNLRSLGKTILLTTHYMDEAQELADRVAVIAKGEIVALGKPHEIGGDEVNITRIRFVLPYGTQASNLPTIEGQIEIRDQKVSISTRKPLETTNRITSWALENKFDLENFRVLRPNLEDVYLALTSEEVEGVNE